MLGAVKELVQIMKEDSVVARSDPVAEDLSEQKKRVEKLEAEQRNLAMEVREIKEVAQSTAEVAQSTAANVAMVLRLLQQGGVVPVGRGPSAGESSKE